MTTLEYTLKLFKTASDQLGVPFVKTTPTNLQNWATKNEPPFIALIGLSESVEKNDAQASIISYDCTFVVCATSSKTPTIEEKIQTEIEVDKLTKRFTWFVNRNEKVSLTSESLEELFRGASYRGVARGLTFTLTLPDMLDYCDDWCNESTVKIDCND